MTFYWYDFETYGNKPSTCRPIQFAGVRTDEDLIVVGDPLVLHSRPTPDFLPCPESCLVHGITPQVLFKKGVTEANFAKAIHAELSEPGTCSVAYNGMRFDHEVMRYLFHRSLIEPYGWHWRDECSRWDLVDVARAAYSLSPNALQWPLREDGAPSFKLEHLAAANEIDHENAHDALSDVMATIGLARRLKAADPAFFQSVLQLRDKSTVAELLTRPCFWASSFIPAKVGAATIVAPLCFHPRNHGSVIVFDLRHDPEPFEALSAESLQELLFARSNDLPKGQIRPPLYEVKTNACPVVAPAKVVTEDVADRLTLDLESCRAHYRKLQQLKATFGRKAAAVYDKEWLNESDVDEDLYSAFVPDADRNTLAKLHEQQTWGPETAQHSFKDGRLPELVFRYRARNFRSRLTYDENDRWKDHCRRLHLNLDQDGLSRLDAYDLLIKDIGGDPECTPRQAELMGELAQFATGLRSWLA